MIDKNDPRLTDFLLGELDAQQRSEIQLQIDQDPELAAAIVELRQAIDLIGRSYQTEPALTLSTKQQDELRAAIDAGSAGDQSGEKEFGSASETNHHRPSSEPSTVNQAQDRSMWWLLAASLMAVLIGGSLWLNNGSLVQPLARVENATADRIADEAVLESDDEPSAAIDDVVVDSDPAIQLGQPMKKGPPMADIESAGSSVDSVVRSRSGKEYRGMPREQEKLPDLATNIAPSPKSETRQFDSKAVDSEIQQQAETGGLAVQKLERKMELDSALEVEDLMESMQQLGGGRQQPEGQLADRGLAPRDVVNPSGNRETQPGETYQFAPSQTADSSEMWYADNFIAPILPDDIGKSQLQFGLPGQKGLQEESTHLAMPSVELPAESSAKNDLANNNYFIELAPEITQLEAGGAAGGAIGRATGGGGLGGGMGGRRGSGRDALDLAGRSPGSGSQRNKSQSESDQDVSPPSQKSIADSANQQDQLTRKAAGASVEEPNRALSEPLVTRSDNKSKSKSGEPDEGPEASQPYLMISPAKAIEIADRLAMKVDPQASNQIQIVDMPGSAAASQGGQTTNSESLSRAEEETTPPTITLSGETADFKRVESLINELADKQGIEKELRERILWKQQVQRALDVRNQQVRRANTWKRVKAVPNASRLMIGENDELALSGMQVNVQIDGFRARVLLDCFYYNDRGESLEGNFKLRLPDDASPYYFAFGESAYEYQPDSDWVKQEFVRRSQSDEIQFVSLEPEEIRQQRQDDWKNCKEARMVPRERAALAYNQTMRRKIDPALVEWAGAGVFNARVFPLSPNKMHRIVIGYDTNLVRSEDGWNYQLDLPERIGQCQVDIHVSNHTDANIAVESDDPMDERVARKHFHFANPQSQKIRVNLERSADVMLSDSDPEQGDFWGVQFVPDLPAEAVAGNSKAIFLLDTSLSSNPDKFNVWLKLLRSTLDNNRDSIRRFNVVFFDVGSSFWRERYVENTIENVAALMQDCDGLALEGATDLYGVIERVTTAEWIYGDDSTGPDLFLLSDGAANWGETNLRVIQNQITEKRMGNLFAYQTGLMGTEMANLRFLANQSGGAVFSVATEDEIQMASTAHRKRPWKLTTIRADGASDVLTAGRVQWVYPGQSIMVVGRGNPSGELQLMLNQGDRSKTVSVQAYKIKSEMAGRLYGQVAVGQLESLGSQVFDVASAYARHFRVTGQTCSLLMLETDAEYEAFGIRPQEDLFVVRSKAASQLIEDLLRRYTDELANPKSQMMAWIKRLESLQGMEFKIPTALGTVIDQLKIEAISRPLESEPRKRQAGATGYLNELPKLELSYDVIASEAKQRSAESVDQAIKVLSNLVERNPGDLVVARDVAFSAMELDRPAQAYSLLLNVAKARPYEGSVYPALAQCLTRLKQADMAILFYEIGLEANFQNRDEDFRKIVAAEYLHLLRQISAGTITTSVPEFADARMATLQKMIGSDSVDLLITMMWNTDQTDVDLHVVEPTGEECSYENRVTRIGGQLTTDITTGFGPEMYWLPNARQGKYDVQVKLFNQYQNRTSLRNKVYLTVYRDYGRPNERVTRKTIELESVGEKESVLAVGIEPK